MIWKNTLFIFLLFSITSGALLAQDDILFEIRNLQDGDRVMPYRIMLPENFDPLEEYPLIIFLHGSGERGRDNKSQLKHGGSFFASDSIRKKYPSIVVFPQCSIDQSWNNSKLRLRNGTRNYEYPELIEPNGMQDMLTLLLRDVSTEYLLDGNRIYVGGLSNGGKGTFEAVRRNPGIFAAAFPICGGANPVIASELIEVSWWIFHGEADGVVPASNSKGIYESLKAENADVQISLYPGVGHDSWTNAFSEPGLMSWLFSKTLD